MSKPTKSNRAAPLISNPSEGESAGLRPGSFLHFLPVRRRTILHSSFGRSSVTPSHGKSRQRNSSPCPIRSNPTPPAMVAQTSPPEGAKPRFGRVPINTAKHGKTRYRKKCPSRSPLAPSSPAPRPRTRTRTATEEDSKCVRLWLDRGHAVRHTVIARACGVWTYEPRQGRKAATAVCFAIAAVTLAPFQ